jgi:nucleotide-binding universal stress UspA family protein
VFDILAPTDCCRSWRANMRFAAQMAARFDGSLTGLYVPDDAPTPPTLPVPSVDEELKQEFNDERWAARHAAGDFRRWAADMGVERADWQLAAEPETDVIVRASNWHDVIAFERSTEPDGWIAGRLAQLVTSVQTPCLIVPSDAGDFRLHTVVVAWNGSPEAARALHAALPLLRRAGRVVVINGARIRPQSGPLWPPAASIEDYLAWQKVLAETVTLDTTPDQAGAKILFEAGNVGADLLVMGAFGRTRFAEHWFGGATLHALRNSRIPLFMRH